MNFYVLPEQALVICWSPKCACTAICDWLVNGVIKPPTPIKGNNRLFLRDNGYFQQANTALPYIFDHGFTPILFTRNPLSRLESAFLSKFVFGKNKPIASAENLEQFTLNTINAYYGHIGYSGEYRGIALLELLDYVADCIKNNRLDLIDHHWAPQTLALVDETYALMKGKRFLVKQENFYHDLKNINCALGLTYLPPHLNKTMQPADWTNVATPDELARMHSYDIVLKKLKIAKNQLLSNAAKAAIEDIFYHDFKAFSYTIPKT